MQASGAGGEGARAAWIFTGVVEMMGQAKEPREGY